ncbi:MAG: LysM peptidoglycan-binding domain-containing M23 family metallopeptidase [Candidatus Brocadiia bacterium]
MLLCALALGTGCRAPGVPPPPQLSAGEPAPAPAEQPYSYLVHEVRHGDTLSSLARSYGVAWHEIAEENGIRDPSQLEVGQLLLIRSKPGHQARQEPEHSAEEPAERIPVSDAELHRGQPSARFWWPTSGRVVRHFQAPVRGLPEPGIGLAAARGTEVCAVAAGQVLTVQHAGGAERPPWGSVVVLEHSGDWVSWYAQLDRILVDSGERVARGEPIGTVGSSGATQRAELAFRLYRDERPVNPEAHLP